MQSCTQTSSYSSTIERRRIRSSLALSLSVHHFLRLLSTLNFVCLLIVRVVKCKKNPPLSFLTTKLPPLSVRMFKYAFFVHCFCRLFDIRYVDKTRPIYNKCQLAAHPQSFQQ